MKFNSNVWRGVVISVVVAFVLAACGHVEQRSDPRQEKDLDEVVEALQYAIETAAADKVWKATELEGKHWAGACKDAKSKSADACFAMFTKATPLCQLVCAGPNCSPAGQRQCEMLLKGDTVDQMCAGTVSSAQGDWCTAARGCSSSGKVAAQVCENAASIVMPELVKGEVSLSVERKREVSGSVNVLIVSFGGGLSEAANNVVKMTLKPRVRDKAYGSADITPLPVAKIPSERSKALAAELARAITEAVAASVKEYESGTPEIPKRGPVLVSDLEVTFALSVDSNGKLGIKKAWDTVGIEVGGAVSAKRVNSLTVTYARPN